MKQLILTTDSSSNTSTITIMPGVASRIRDVIGDMKKWSSIHIIYDQNVGDLAHTIAKELKTTYLIMVSQPELHKSFRGVETIIKKLHEAGADRHSLVVNVGGGALIDCGGFAASVYMRGIPFMSVPTTLLAQVDASVGGKTGINACGTKNLVGSFTQPIHVIIDPETVHALPDDHFSSGCAEMLKHGLIIDADYWHTLSSTTMQTLRTDTSLLESAIFRSCEIKHAVVSKDEHENGERKLLNFGHTVGHAIEAYSHTTDHPYLHGQAVALGMIVEAELSEITKQEQEHITTVLQRYNLPTKLRNACDTELLIALMRSDKKNHAGQIKWTLLEKIGTSHYDVTRSLENVRVALGRIMP